MVNLTANQQQELVAAANAASKVLAAGQIVLMIYEKFTGLKYSEADIKRLEELKRIHVESFRGEDDNYLPPVNWELDEKNCPTNRIKHQNWSLHLKQLKQGKSTTGNFHYEATLIAEYAATYLTHRGERYTGTGGKGTSGDLLEQFMGEWVDYAVNDLSTYKYNELAMEKFAQRIRYIEKIQKHEHLFRFGKFERGKNKFDTLQSIKEQLQVCLNKTKQEKLRRCARDEFDTCHKDTAGLLLACARALYYARAIDVHLEPFELSRFIHPEGRHLTKDATKLYPKIKETHTGAMLYEVINIAGLESFGTVDEFKPNQSPMIYFDPQFQIRPVDWKSKSADLPHWVSKESTEFHLNEFQKFCHSLLKVSELKRLILEGYELTGKVGDLWAYGDKQGKKSLEALLFLMETELDELKKKFDELYEFHNSQRLAYNLANKINAINGQNPNFNKVDEQKSSIESHYKSLKNATKTIHEQMKNFPEDAAKRIDQKKNGFYKAITHYIKQFHPSFSSRYNILGESPISEKLLELDSDSNAKKVSTALSSTADSKSESEIENNLSPNQNQINKFALPLAYEANNSYAYFDKNEFKQFVCADASEIHRVTKAPWNLGDKYSHWMKSYFTRQKNDFENYQKLSIILTEIVDASWSLDKIKNAEIKLIRQIDFLKLKLEDERPKWRFKLGVWPIKTKGWPFNRDANKFSELLVSMLSAKEGEIRQACKQAEDRIANNDGLSTDKVDIKNQSKPNPNSSVLVENELAEPKSPVKKNVDGESVESSERIQQLLKRHADNNQKHADLIRGDLATESVIGATPVEPSSEKTRSDLTAAITADTNKEVKPLSPDSELINAQKGDYFDLLYKSAMNKLNEWEDSEMKNPLVFVSDKQSANDLLMGLLNYRDKLDSESLEYLVNSCIDLIYLINFQVKTPAAQIDKESIDQASVILNLLSAVMTIEKSDDRLEKVKIFNLSVDATFARVKLNTSMRDGYSTNELLSVTDTSEIVEVDSIDQAVTLPSLNMSRG